MKQKTYHIDTLEKLLNVASHENFENIMIDFSSWLKLYLNYVGDVREKYPEETKGKENTEISSVQFIWIDDGKHDVKEAIVVNNKTGKVTEL